MATSSESSGEMTRDEAYAPSPTTRNSSFTSAGGETVTPVITDIAITGKGDLEHSRIVGESHDEAKPDSINVRNEGAARSEIGEPENEEDRSRPSSPYGTRNSGTDQQASQAASYLKSIEHRLQFLESRLQQLDPTAPPDLYTSMLPIPHSPPYPPPPPTLSLPPLPSDQGVDLTGLAGDPEHLHHNTNHDRPFNLEDQIVSVAPEKWKESRNKRLIPANSTLIVERKELDPGTSIHQSGATDSNAIEGGGEGTKKVGKACPSQVPDRVAIGSCGLIHDIGRIADLKMSHIPNVFIKPYKIFVSHEKEIRESALKEELKYHTLVSEAKEKAKLKKILEKESADHKKTGGDKGSSKVNAELPYSIAEMDDEFSLEPEEDYFDKSEKIQNSEMLSNDYKCLIHLLDTDLKPILDLRREIANNTLESIAHDELWHLFTPGDLVISNHPKPQAYRVMHVTGGRPLLSPNWKPSMSSMDYSPYDPLIRHGKTNPLILDCFYIDFDGKSFGPASQRIEIQPYDGKRLIKSLDVYPMPFDKDQEALEDMLEKRGARFVELSQVTHKRYTGLSLIDAPMFERTEELDSDVIIDFALAFRSFREDSEDSYIRPQINGGVVDSPTKGDRRETFELYPCSVASCNTCTDNHDDSLLDLKLRSDFLSKTDLLQTIDLGKEKLGRDRLILLPRRVYGYVLLSRKFYPLDIDTVEDIPVRGRNLDGFRDLVIDDDHKRIVKALVKTHTRGPRATISIDDGTEVRAPERQLDLVRGKGRGLIILLHGVPGVGKTSTAECVAASTGRPLFPITCGDIGGESASQVEDNLESYFELAHKWGCVLLLDEADVFLARRRRGDMKQNSLVSVFLRVLEYYSGILILTTNRVGEFDEAIKSRIHISLYYKALDRASTLRVWKMNLERLNRENKKPPPHRKIDFDHEEIMEFARGHWRDGHRWNGRQIKNAFQTAIALAEWDVSESTDSSRGDTATLEAKHFKDVAVASAHFDQYLLKVREGQSEQMQAREMGIRRDDFNETGTLTASGVTFPKPKATRPRRDEDYDSEEDYDNRGYESDSRKNGRGDRDSRRLRSNAEDNCRRKSNVSDFYNE